MDSLSPESVASSWENVKSIRAYLTLYLSKATCLTSLHNPCKLAFFGGYFGCVSKNHIPLHFCIPKLEHNIKKYCSSPLIIWPITVSSLIGITRWHFANSGTVNCVNIQCNKVSQQIWNTHLQYTPLHMQHITLQTNNTCNFECAWYSCPTIVHYCYIPTMLLRCYRSKFQQPPPMLTRLCFWPFHSSPIRSLSSGTRAHIPQAETSRPSWLSS